MPMVSVVIPAYNAAPWIAETLRSVLSQTFQDFEIIVVDDGSTDDTAALVAKFKGVRLIRINHAGVSTARNIAIQSASGEYIAFLDADDLWLPRKLELQIELLEKERLAWAYGDAIAFDDQSRRTLFRFSSVRQQYSGKVLQLLLLGDFIPSPTPVVKHRVFEQVGYFNESPIIQAVEDWDMWLRIAAEYPIGRVNGVLAKYRVHQASTVQSKCAEDLFKSNLYVIDLAVSRQPQLIRVKNRAVARLSLRIGQFAIMRDDLLMARRMFAQAIRLCPTEFVAYPYFLGTWLNRRMIDIGIRLIRWLRFQRSVLIDN
jgi:teichuronic acid biosynthesis glycosyltransferase TuaG